MKNFYFYWFLLAVGVFSVCGQKNSSENENGSKISNEKTKSESDSISTEKHDKKHNEQSFLLTPDESLLINQKLFRIHPRFLEGHDRVPPVRVPIGGQRQNVYLTDDFGRYNVHLENFQHERPTNFQTALGAISAHIINRKNEEYIPYPPNGDPYSYPAYRGNPLATEPPVIGAYERSRSSKIDAPPLLDFGQQNPRRAFTNIDNIYRRTFPEFGNLGPGFYPGNLYNNGSPDQVRDSEKINKWYEHHGDEYPREGEFFKAH